MKKRIYEYQPYTPPPIIKERNHREFADMVDRLQKITPVVLDDATSYEYTVDDILSAIKNQDLETARAISNYFWRASLLYRRLILYFVTMHKNFWVDIPVTLDPSKARKKSNQMERTYYSILAYLEKYRFRDTTPNILLSIFRKGAFYGYLIEGDSSNSWQELDCNYCRSKYTCNGIPVVEFDIQYFDDKYTQQEDRELAFKKFPAEFKKWYNRWKNGQISATTSRMWVPLDTKYCTRFALSDDEFPIFFGAIPELIRLQKNKNIADERALQQLFKLVVHKMPLNKNDDLIFDQTETEVIHKKASAMLSNAPGVDLFTTWADVDLLNLDTTEAQTRNSDLTDPEVFWQETGTSQLLFAATGNASIKYSYSKDATIIFRLMASYETFINMRLANLFNMAQVVHHFKFLDITEQNQDEMLMRYKELATLGYSKLYVSIAAGISQAECPALVDFENNNIQILEKLIALSSTYTGGMSSQLTGSQGGRPEVADNDKSEKTIVNIESQT